MVSIEKIVAAFEVEGKVAEYVPFGNGHINDTRLVTMDNGVQYVLQRINKNVFKNPPALMENYTAVTEFLRGIIIEKGGDPDRETLNVVKTLDGKNYYLDENGESHYTTTPEGEEEITATVSILDGEECHNHLSDQAAVSTLARVRVRGNSSLNFVDETDANVSHSVMGMDPHHEWVLHGPILDKTLIRNYVWYNVAGEVMDYAPNVRFCEAFINGEYMGLYLMVESVTAGDNDSRLQLSINRKNNTFTGYCLRVDDGSNEIKDLNTFSMYTYQTEGVVDSVYPGTSNLTPEMKARIQKDFSAFERILYSGDYNDPRYGYEAYIDVDSFVDYFILNEFSSNYDAGARSTYIYKEVGGPYKLCVWDFNSALDNYQEQAVDPEMFLLQNRVWFNALIQDGRFTERVIQRYRELRETYLSEEYLNQYIDETIAYLGDAIDRKDITYLAPLPLFDKEGNAI